MSVLSPYSDWCVPHRRVFSAVPTIGIGGCRQNKSLLLAVQLSESVHEKRNGSEVRKQAIRHTKTAIIFRFHLTWMQELYDYKSLCETVCDGREWKWNAHAICCLYISRSLSSGCLFWMTNINYRRLLVRRVIATHACAVRTCYLAVGWSICGVFQCDCWPRRRRREATQQSGLSGRVLWCQFGVSGPLTESSTCIVIHHKSCSAPYYITTLKLITVSTYLKVIRAFTGGK